MRSLNCEKLRIRAGCVRTHTLFFFVRISRDGRLTMQTNSAKKFPNLSGCLNLIKKYVTFYLLCACYRQRR